MELGSISASFSSEIIKTFTCPLTGQIMQYPMQDPSGHNFERDAIYNWLSQRGEVCPLNYYERLTLNDLIPNDALQNVIMRWREEQNRQKEFKGISRSIISVSSSNDFSQIQKETNKLLEQDEILLSENQVKIVNQEAKQLYELYNSLNAWEAALKKNLVECESYIHELQFNIDVDKVYFFVFLSDSPFIDKIVFNIRDNNLKLTKLRCLFNRKHIQEINKLKNNEFKTEVYPITETINKYGRTLSLIENEKNKWRKFEAPLKKAMNADVNPIYADNESDQLVEINRLLENVIIEAKKMVSVDEVLEEKENKFNQFTLKLNFETFKNFAINKIHDLEILNSEVDNALSLLGYSLFTSQINKFEVMKTYDELLKVGEITKLITIFTTELKPYFQEIAQLSPDPETIQKLVRPNLKMDLNNPKKIISLINLLNELTSRSSNIFFLDKYQIDGLTSKAKEIAN